MIGKTNIIDEFIGKLRRRAEMPGTGPFIDDLEEILEALFISDDKRAIDMSDAIRAVIERKRMSLEERVAAIRKILKDGSVHL